MLDLIGAIAGTGIFAMLVGMLIAYAQVGTSRKLGTLAAAAGWGAIVVAVAALGGFAPGVIGPIPAPVFAFTAILLVLLGAWFWFPKFHDALLSVPLAVLTAVNVARIGGVLFLVLLAQGRLSAPFAPSAGWGDIITGLFAVPLALMARHPSDRVIAPLVLWNIFGALDLIVAISLGLLSAPGLPFRIFTEAPGTLALTELPWVMVPTMLVPIYLLIHLVIATKLRSLHRTNWIAAVAR